MSKRGPKVRQIEVIPLNQDWAIPDHLGEVARREFARVVDLLEQRQALEMVDSTLVTRRAELCELAESLYLQLIRDGSVVKSDRGNISVHPAAKQLTSIAPVIKNIDEALGLTASRNVVKTNPVPAEEDPLSGMIKLHG